MAVLITHEHDKNVLEVAKLRIENTFSNGVPVYLSTSGGKDSIVMSDIVYQMCITGQVDKSLLTVVFIDEEAMHQDVIDIVSTWRKKWLMIGVPFEWYCIEAVHFSCFNQLTSDESFIMWDRYKKDVWVRDMPSFAITDHPLLDKRREPYQSFLEKRCMGGISLIGVRAAESVQRRINLAMKFAVTESDGMGVAGTKKMMPIYDFTDNDIWLYIRENRLDFPKTYLNLYQIGQPRNKLRLSQFFSIDTAQVLVGLAEYDSELMDKVIKREPNAYLAMMYWDSEMFRRSSPARRKMEKQENIDYKQKLIELVSDIDGNFDGENARKIANAYRRLVIRNHDKMTQKVAKRVYEALKAGDPKMRSYRGVLSSISSDYVKTSKIVENWKD